MTMPHLYPVPAPEEKAQSTGSSAASQKADCPLRDPGVSGRGAILSNSAFCASGLRRMNSLQRRAAEPFFLRLQQQYGNWHVQRVLSLARKGGEGQVDSDVESRIERSRGAGQALESGTRLQMESAFGTNFEGVRVHTNPEAHGLNEAVGALAFTTGKDIYFRGGAYNPGSSSGRELLAHELTHVVQQREGQVQGKLVLGPPDDEYEQEADRTAKAVVNAAHPPISEPPTASTSLHRQCSCGAHSGSSGSCPECAKKAEHKET